MPDAPDQPQDFASLFAAYEKEQASREKAGAERKRRGPAPGDKVEGTIVGFGEESAFVDLGGKSEGVVPLAELTDRDGERTHRIGSPCLHRRPSGTGARPGRDHGSRRGAVAPPGRGGRGAGDSRR